jgi:hypothetical protein
MSEQDREYLRHLYAMFAMLKMNWKIGDDKTDAEDCFRIADTMLEASERKTVDEGIVSIKKRRSKNENTI